MVNRTAKKLNIGIIGGGIVSYIAAYEISQLLFREKKSDFSLTIIDGSSYIPAASWNSTATVALRNTQKEMSELGDLIKDGYDHLQYFVEKFSPAGIEKVNFYTLDQSDDEKWKQRYPNFKDEGNIEELKSFFAGNMYQEEGFIFDPKIYQQWLLKNSQAKVVTDFILDQELNDSWKLTGVNHRYEFDFVISCLGAQALEVSAAQGGYFQASFDLGQKSFFLECDGLNLIYRHQKNEVQFGATTMASEIYPLGVEELSKKLKKFASYFPHLHLLEQKWKFFSALRAKAKKRLPVFLMTSQKIEITGLYKNGFCLTHNLFLKRERDIVEALL